VGAEFLTMEGQETKHITVTIANRPYPLKIKAEDEGIIRKIAKEVNEKINRFQLSYTNKDKQDCMAMVVLTYAIDLQKTKQLLSSTQDTELSERLAQLDTFLRQLLA
jgi:cell division protein ZapA (FtsZ GTPase activity inhibitor)